MINHTEEPNIVPSICKYDVQILPSYSRAKISDNVPDDGNADNTPREKEHFERVTQNVSIDNSSFLYSK
jgi:hypothetical protein